MLTVVLKATGGDPQVKVPAPSLETGSHPKRGRRHGQPAPIVAAPTALRRLISPHGTTRPETRTTERERPRQATTGRPRTKFSGQRDRRGDQA